MIGRIALWLIGTIAEVPETDAEYDTATAAVLAWWETIDRTELVP
jgi:hypothetical protein